MMPKKVYVSNGDRGPHVYTSIKRLYKGIRRVFPKGADIHVIGHPIGVLTEENLWTALRRWQYLKVRDDIRYITISQTYLDDELPPKEVQPCYEE